MHCKNCLAPLNAEDTYCKVCGTPIERKENYPSNEEIIQAYNNENMRLSANKSVGEKRPVSTENMTSSFRPVERREEVTRVATPTSEEPVYSTSTPTSLPQHEPILVAEPKGLTIPSREEMEVPESPVQERKEKKEEKGIGKKSFALGIVISIIVTALITVLICIPLVSRADKKEEVPTKPKDETKIVTENRVLFSGYSFIIPEGYSHKISGTQLIVEKKDTKEAMSLQIGTGTYANMKANLTSLKKNLTDSKWEVGKLYVDQAIDQRNYLTVEATVNKQKVLIAYTTADDTQVFGIIYLNPKATTYPNETVESFNEIIDSALKVNNPVNTNIADFTKNKIMFTITGTDKPNQGSTTQGGTQANNTQAGTQTGTQTNVQTNNGETKPTTTTSGNKQGTTQKQ